MNLLVRSCLPLLFLVAALPVAAAEPDHPGIHAVIESFRTAIIQRDKPRFLGLFLQPDAPWQLVNGDATLAQIQKERPQAIKARYKAENNPVAFIDGIVRSERTSEETFSNIRIDGDADVATVTFDYTFKSDGRETNHGTECWLMVRTQDGWKITTLAYSYNR
ncbi:nuclear transport factor 2 family protein [Noviluteimonas dokdonensis]|uniref:nuclear transport factor 2 family protein n=1 Tax=Noviluteimonas dokdonensis TaxID=414050 RepID=UPI00055D4120|nr:nuclear transport factor 2 family protein [Lysobacter dokdonensis]